MRRCRRLERVQAGGAEQPGVLQVALAPAAVARRELDEVRRRLLVAAAEVVGHAAPSSRRAGRSAASTKSWLRMCPPNGGLPGSSGRPPRSAKARGADDGVVAPVVAGVAEPGARGRGPAPGRRRGRRTAARGRAASRRRSGAATVWRMPSAVVGLHAARELDDGVGLHQAVGVEHQHEGVGAAPALDPVGDVAGLARAGCGARWR